MSDPLATLTLAARPVPEEPAAFTTDLSPDPSATVGASSDPYAGTSAARTAQLVASREASALDVVDAALARLDALDPHLRAFCDVWPARAREYARVVDRAVAAGRRLPLAGVPLAVKASEGTGSLQARRLLEAGCVPIGTTSVPGPGTPW